MTIKQTVDQHIRDSYARPDSYAAVITAAQDEAIKAFDALEDAPSGEIPPLVNYALDARWRYETDLRLRLALTLLAESWSESDDDASLVEVGARIRDLLTWSQSALPRTDRGGDR